MLEQVNYSMAWLKHQEANKRRQEEALERKRVSYTQVDWHNFVVVETVDYQPWEVGNPPTNPGEVDGLATLSLATATSPFPSPNFW